MPITSTDLLVKYSVTSGSAGNQNAGTAAGALGKYISTTQITDNTLNNLFDNISGDENAGSVVDYRCIFIHNAHGSLTWQTPVVWLLSEVAGGANIQIGVDPTAASAIGSAGAQAVQIANELAVPAGVSFSAPTSQGAALALGDIPPGQCKALWVKRSAANSAALSNDGVTLRFQGNSL